MGALVLMTDGNELVLFVIRFVAYRAFIHSCNHFLAARKYKAALLLLTLNV